MPYTWRRDQRYITLLVHLRVFTTLPYLLFYLLLTYLQYSSYAQNVDLFFRVRVVNVSCMFISEQSDVE